MKLISKTDKTIISNAFEETYSQIGENVFYASCVQHEMDSYGKNVIYIGKLNPNPLKATVSTELNVNEDLNNIESVYDRKYKTVNLIKSQCVELEIFPKNYDALLIGDDFYIILGRVKENFFNTEFVLDSFVTIKAESFNTTKLVFLEDEGE